MSPLERKAAFRQRVDLDGKTLGAVAFESIGCGWIHLSEGLKGNRPLSAEVKQKFSAYIGRTVEDVFGGEAVVDAGQSIEDSSEDDGDMLGRGSHAA